MPSLLLMKKKFRLKLDTHILYFWLNEWIAILVSLKKLHLVSAFDFHAIHFISRNFLPRITKATSKAEGPVTVSVDFHVRTLLLKQQYTSKKSGLKQRAQHCYERLFHLRFLGNRRCGPRTKWLNLSVHRLLSQRPWLTNTVWRAERVRRTRRCSFLAGGTYHGGIKLHTLRHDVHMSSTELRLSMWLTESLVRFMSGKFNIPIVS